MPPTCFGGYQIFVSKALRVVDRQVGPTNQRNLFTLHHQVKGPQYSSAAARSRYGLPRVECRQQFTGAVRDFKTTTKGINSITSHLLRTVHSSSSREGNEADCPAKWKPVGGKTSSDPMSYLLKSQFRFHRPIFKFQMSPLTTSSSHDGEKQDEADEQAAIESAEPDFKNYVAEDMHSLSKDSKQLLAARRKSRSRAVTFGLDVDKRMYEQILKTSRQKKEQSRIRTEQNVNRALYGNLVICIAKLGAWMSSGSSAMLSEFIHSCVDCGNQALLVKGLRDSRLAPDRMHPYGYGKSVYFWALVSALGTFFLGAGVSMTNAIGDLLNPSLTTITNEVWGVLIFSFLVDGYVLVQTVKETYHSKPDGVSYWTHVQNIRDPATLAVLLEDGAACLGIIFAMGGIGLSHATGNAVFDGVAGVAISSLLGAVGIALVRVNQNFLLGQAVDKETTDGIANILKSSKSIESIGSVQSQWTGPESFAYKAEVDFDGTYLAAKLMPRYQIEFLQIRDRMDDELKVLLAFYAEDVMRTVEREVRHVESQIRKQYPGAEYIELEPMSIFVDQLAIDDNLEEDLRRLEDEEVNQFINTLKTEAKASSTSENENTKQR